MSSHLALRTTASSSHQRVHSRVEPSLSRRNAVALPGRLQTLAGLLAIQPVRSHHVLSLFCQPMFISRHLGLGAAVNLPPAAQSTGDPSAGLPSVTNRRMVILL